MNYKKEIPAESISFPKKRLLFLLGAFLLILCSSAYPQYQVYQWANFENGAFPPQSLLLGDREKIGVVDLEKMAQLYPNLGVKETGKYCMMVTGKALPKTVQDQKTGKDKYLTGMCLNVLLDRDKIGANGRALYQADIYIPGGTICPAIGVLAMAPLNPGETVPQSMYRLGLLYNGTTYFSYVVKDSLEASLHKRDEESATKLPRPGWHRFAIVFEGPETIRCYIDGTESKFSPIKEPSLRKLQVGILLAEYSNDYLCFVDNPSIQWTVENVPLPDSPYSTSWKEYVKPASENLMETLSVASKIEWLDPDEGWKKATKEQKNMLIYFQAPRAQATMALNTIFQQNFAAQNFLRQYVLVNIDVNQLKGGEYSSQFGIFKVPTVVIVSPQNKVIAKEIFGKNDTWETFEARLKK